METLLNLLGLANDTINWIIKIVQPKIRTTPKIIKLDRKDWESEGYFTVCNIANEPLYEVQILLWHHGEGASESLFPLIIKSIEGQEDEPKTRVGPIVVNTSVLIIEGAVKGNKIKLLQLGYLRPRKSIRVFYSSSSQQKGEIFIQAVSVSPLPPQTLKKSGSMAIAFKPPRDIEVTGVSLFMKRD